MQKREPKLEDRFIPLRELDHDDIEMKMEPCAVERYQIGLIPSVKLATEPLTLKQEL